MREGLSDNEVAELRRVIANALRSLAAVTDVPITERRTGAAMLRMVDDLLSYAQLIGAEIYDDEQEHFERSWRETPGDGA